MQHKEAIDWLEANQIQVEDASKANPSSSHVQGRVRSRKLIPSPMGWVKCNFDSGFIR